MLDILPNTKVSEYLPPFDDRPLHVYIMCDHNTIHLQLAYHEFNTYSNACKVIKIYWEQFLFQSYPDSPMVLTNNIGAVIHRENWTAFVAARCPCLAWYGGQSLNQLLGEIRKKKDVLNKHLAQLHVTEAVVHFAEERPINGISGSELWGPNPEDAQEDPLVLAWEILNSIASDEYSGTVEQGSHPHTLFDVFEQNQLDPFDPLTDIPHSQTTRPLTPESMTDNSG